MIDSRSALSIFKGSVEAGDAIIFGWNETTCFYDYAQISNPSRRLMECLKVSFEKRTIFGQGDIEDESTKWKDSIASTVICTPDQRILLADGRWERVAALPLGSSLQNVCGNGHFCRVRAIESAGLVECVEFNVNPHGTFVAAGVILAARNHGR